MLISKEDIIANFSSDLEYILENFSKKDHFGLEITTTDRCNMHCDYCFEGSKENSEYGIRYPKEHLLRTIKDIVNDSRFKNKFKNLTLTMWGGEPTLNPGLINYLISYLGDNPLISWYIYTNGLNFENIESIVTKFKEIGCLQRAKFQVSWDGDPLHDIHRNGTSSEVKKNIENLLELGVEVDLKATILPRDFSAMPLAWKSYKEFIDYLSSKGYNVDDVVYSPTIDQTYNCLPSRQNLEDFKVSMRQIAAMEVTYSQKYGKTLLSWFRSRPKSCPYRTNMACVNTKGIIHSCHGVQYIDKLENDEFVGSIDDSSWIDKILYQCPDCKKEHTLRVENDTIVCGRCGFSVRVNEYYELIAKDGSALPFTVDEWFKWQRRCVKDEISNSSFEMSLCGSLCTVRLDKLKKPPKDRVLLSTGKATLTSGGLAFEGTKDGSPADFDFSARAIYSLTLSTQGYLEFYHNNEYYMLIPDTAKRGLIKWTLAAEEIHNLYDEKWQAASDDAYNYSKGDILWTEQTK